MWPRSKFPSCMRTRGLRCDATAPEGNVEREKRNSWGPAAREESTAKSDSDAEDGLAWICLSDLDARSSRPENQWRGRAAGAWADMDWLNLTIASGEPPPCRDRQQQARADMDWLDLQRSPGG